MLSRAVYCPGIALGRAGRRESSSQCTPSSPLRSTLLLLPTTHALQAVVLGSARSVRESLELFEGLSSVREASSNSSSRTDLLQPNPQAVALHSRLAGPPGSGSASPRMRLAAGGGRVVGGVAAPPTSSDTTPPGPLPVQQPAAAAVGAGLGSASAAALYASAVPHYHGRVSPIAHPAKHGMNPRVGGGVYGNGVGGLHSSSAAPGTSGDAKTAAAAAVAAAGRPKQLPAAPFLPSAAAGTSSPASTPSKAAAVSSSSPTSSNSATKLSPRDPAAAVRGDGLRSLLMAGDVGPANSNDRWWQPGVV